MKPKPPRKRSKREFATIKALVSRACYSKTRLARERAFIQLQSSHAVGPVEFMWFADHVISRSQDLGAA